MKKEVKVEVSSVTSVVEKWLADDALFYTSERLAISAIFLTTPDVFEAKSRIHEFLISIVLDKFSVLINGDDEFISAFCFSALNYIDFDSLASKYLVEELGKDR